METSLKTQRTSPVSLVKNLWEAHSLTIIELSVFHLLSNDLVMYLWLFLTKVKDTHQRLLNISTMNLLNFLTLHQHAVQSLVTPKSQSSVRTSLTWALEKLNVSSILLMLWMLQSWKKILLSVTHLLFHHLKATLKLEVFLGTIFQLLLMERKLLNLNWSLFTILILKLNQSLQLWALLKEAQFLRLRVKALLKKEFVMWQWDMDNTSKS